ncbi:DUF4142 domain-containing protein [Plantactinospora siamensis]|uniref:DUF4142 domain-containing protein n=1 Tax=Plantactinospora siamensis TaxID=555372 RepID=A0ABV6NS95_9ACTN
MTATGPSRRLRLAAAVVTGLTGVLLGGLVAAPGLAAAADRTAAAGPPLAGTLGAHLPQAAPSGDPNGPVPNPIELLPGNPSANGPITAADRDFVVKVRLAGLWEMPASQMAVQKGTNDRIKYIGRNIGPQHKVLDAMDRQAAAELGIALPDEPNTDQQGWLKEMRESSGPQFDRIYVDRLRAAHGKIFPAIGIIRASTRNDVVRRLAAQANAFVMTHMTLLESSGLVDYQSLPKAPPPAPAGAAAEAAETAKKGTLYSSGGRMSPTVIWIVLAAAVLAGAYSTVRLVRPR